MQLTLMFTSLLQVKAFGPGLEPIGVIVNKPAEFTIDAREAGNGHLKIYAKDTEGVTIDIKITDKGDGTFLCVYVPIKPIKHTIIITWGDVNVPNSPFRVSRNNPLGFEPRSPVHYQTSLAC